jgi:hypothetical protein
MTSLGCKRRAQLAAIKVSSQTWGSVGAFRGGVRRADFRRQRGVHQDTRTRPAIAAEGDAQDAAHHGNGVTGPVIAPLCRRQTILAAALVTVGLRDPADRPGPTVRAPSPAPPACDRPEPTQSSAGGIPARKVGFFAIVDSKNPNSGVSTKAGQLQYPTCAMACRVRALHRRALENSSSRPYDSGDDGCRSATIGGQFVGPVPWFRCPPISKSALKQ